MNNVVHEHAADDGEPNGSSGLPILNVLKRNNLVNAAIYVVSIYGGVNIRSGGTESLYSFYGRLGLRYQPIKRGVMFRASYLNLIPYDFDYS